MNEKEINKIMRTLMGPDWTENLHEELKVLQPEDSKKIVESMTDSEIFQKVNARRFQEDYIADYLEYLWEISETAFWKHVNISENYSKVQSPIKIGDTETGKIAKLIVNRVY